MSLVPRSDRVWQAVQTIREAQGRICTDFLVIGQLLAEVKAERLHEAWAEHTTTFDLFLADIGIRRTSAYNALRVWEQYGHRDVQGIPMDRLVALSEMKLPEEEKEVWLEKARELPARGLRDEARQRRGLKATDECAHERTVVLHKCLDCGFISK